MSHVNLSEMDQAQSQSQSTSTSSPPLIRPVPRRPFDLRSVNPTSPPDDSEPSPSPGTPSRNHNQNVTARFLGLTNADSMESSASNNSETFSRAASIMNLTKSTLFGIYSNPSSPSSPNPAADDSGPITPGWGTGADTPPRKSVGVDDATFMVMRDRAHGLGIISSGPRPGSRGSNAGGSSGSGSGSGTDVLPVVVRWGLLFGLGMGYGFLGGRLRSGDNPFGVAVAAVPRDEASEWAYLLFWGCAGVAQGLTLPWFDGVWERSFGGRFETGRGERGYVKRAREAPEPSPRADWLLVVRGIGAFVGIVFAIRKLPWASTMQVSLTLALANPFLWYLIDRSKTGFLLSAAVGITGSAIMMGLNPDMVPAPAARGSALRNATGLYRAADDSPGALPEQHTIDTAIWTASVLFCSCLCLGNIGRRLAPGGGAAARGRWGGVR